MLTEIALTPQTFQGGGIGAADWLAQVKLLIRRLLQYGQQCPVIFSNLNSHPQNVDWRTRVGSLIPQTQPAATRQALDALIRLIDPHVVARPRRNHVHNIADELHWVQEAVHAHPGFPIAQVVVTYGSHGAAGQYLPAPVNVNQLEQAAFWAGILPCAFPAMNIAGQITLLRPFWLHGQILALVLPYALEGEADWFFAFVRAAVSRPQDFAPPQIELYTSFGGNGADLVAQQRNHQDITRFIQRARQSLPRGVTFTLSVRPRSHGSQRFICRRLFAVEPANVGTGTPAIRVRWGAAFEHVAMPNDAANQTPPTFMLLPRTQATIQHQFECINAHLLLGPETITM